jgi:hypothetical protein
MDFELFTRFKSTDLCSYYLIVAPIANRPRLQFGQEVHRGHLQGFHYQQADMHGQ